MAEKIGLLADLDLTKWDLAVSRYLNSLEEMKRASSGIAGSIGTSFTGFSGTIGGALVGMSEMVLSHLAKMAADIYEAYRQLGKNLLIAVTTAVTAIVGAFSVAANAFVDWTVAGIKANTEFEQNMADIGSVLRKTREEVGPLADKIDELALDPQLVVSTEQASGVIEQLSRNGVEMTDILGGAAEATVLLANATGGDMVKAADVATMAMQMFNMKASEMSKIADISQGVINNSRIELDDWALALGNTGAAAAAFGVPLEDVATAIGGTVNLFHTARQAGTGYMNFLQRLVPLTIPAADKMRELGLFAGLSGQEFEKLAGQIAETEAKIAALDPTNESFTEDSAKLTEKLSDQQYKFEQLSDAIATTQAKIDALSPANTDYAIQAQKLNDKLADQQHKFNELGEEIALTQSQISALDPASETYQTALTKLTDKVGDQQYAQQQLAKQMDTTRSALAALSPTSGDYQKDLDALTAKLADQKHALSELSEEMNGTKDSLAGLSPTSETYQKKLAQLTQTLKEQRAQLNAGNNAFFDEQGVYLGNAKAAQLLADTIGQLSDEQQIAAIRTIFGNDALETAIGFSRMGADGFEKLKSEIVIYGSAAEAAATRTATLAKRWENLQDIWSTIQRKSGAGFNDMLLRLVNRLTELTNQNQDRVIKFFGRMAELIDRIVTATMPWVERMLPVLIDNLEALASWLVELALGGGKAQQWLDKMSPGLRTFLERTIAVVGEIKNFIRQTIEMAMAVREALRPFTDWVAENITFKDVLIAAAGAIAVYVLPGLIKMAATLAFAAKAVSTLRQAWEDDWGGIRTIFENIWPNIHIALVDFVNNFLTGKWGAAWTNARIIVIESLEEIREYVNNSFFKGLIDFMVNVFEGDWEGAWYILRSSAVSTLGQIRDSFLPDVLDPIADMLINLIDGDWAMAWDNAKKFVSGVFTAVVDGLKSLDLPFVNFIFNVLEGKWKDAWNQAVNVVIGVRDTIVEWLEGMNTPFTTFLVDILEGRWSKAWDTAKQAAIDAFTEIKQWMLDHLPGNVGDFIVAVLEGRWSTAWKIAGEETTKVYDIIKQWLIDLPGNFGDFIVAILEGRWKTAWEIAAQETKKVYDGIVAWLLALDTPFATFIATILAGEWSTAWTLAQNAAVTALEEVRLKLPEVFDPIIDFLIDILLGDWVSAWATAEAAVTAAADIMKAAWEGFQELILVAANDDTFPAWLRSIFIAAYAISAAFEEARKTFFGFRTEGDLAFGERADTWQENLTELFTAARQIAEGFEVAALAVRKLFLGIEVVRRGFMNAGELLTEIEAIDARMREIGATWRQEFAGPQGLQIQVPSAIPSGMGIDPAAVQAGFVAEIQKSVDAVMHELKVEYSKMEELARLAGANSLTEFAQAFMPGNTTDALSHIGSFAYEVRNLAETIREGYAEAGDDSVYYYVKALAEKHGIAEEGAIRLANGIIGTFGSRLTDVGGLLIPNALKRTVIDPITGLEVPASLAGYAVGEKSIQAMGAGVDENGNAIFDPIQAAIVEANRIASEMIPASRETGQESVGALGAGVEENRNAALDPMEAVKEEANRQQRELIEYQKSTGKESVEGLGIGVESNKQPTLNTFNNLTNDITEKLSPLVNNIGEIGTDSTQALTLPFSDTAPALMDQGLGAITRVITDWTNMLVPYMEFRANEAITRFVSGIDAGRPLVHQVLAVIQRDMEYWHLTLQAMMRNEGARSTQQFAVGLDMGQRLIIEVTDRIGKAFRDKINEYIEIVIRNFVNIAANVNGLIDLNQFTALGQNIGNALKSGLDSQLSAVQASATALVDAAAVSVEQSAEIASPSKRFWRLASSMVDGLTGGWDERVAGMQSRMASTVDSIAGSMNPRLNQQISVLASPRAAASASYNTYNSPITINNYVYTQMDEAQLQYMMENTLNRAGLGR